MPLNNESLLKLRNMVKANNAGRAYIPGRGDSLPDYRTRTGWENPVGDGASYRGQPVRAFTNRPDSPLVGREWLDTEVIRDDPETVGPGADGTKVVVGKDPYSFNEQVEVDRIMAIDRKGIFDHVFGGQFSSEGDLPPDAVKYYDSVLRQHKSSKLNEARIAKKNAIDTIKATKKKPETAAVSKLKASRRERRFLFNNKLSKDPDTKKIFSDKTYTATERADLEERALNQGWELQFDGEGDEFFLADALDAGKPGPLKGRAVKRPGPAVSKKAAKSELQRLLAKSKSDYGVKSFKVPKE